MSTNEGAGKVAFTTLPLEIRHCIYEFASERPTGSHLILKEYLEKLDPDIPNPTSPAAAVIVPATTNADADDNGEDNAEDEAEGSHDDDLENGIMDNDDEEMDEVQQREDEDDPMIEDTDAPAPVIHTQGHAGYADGQDAMEEDEDGDDSNEEEEQEDEAEQEEDEDEDEEDDDEEGEDEQDVTSTTLIPAQRQHSYGRNTVYRHMLPIIKLNRCPPPMGLLKTCKQLESEAIEYHRNKCFLTIDVNKAFQHHSFFLETIEKFSNNAFSPLEHMRKVNVVITWDSEWLREKTEGPESERPMDPATVFFLAFYLGERVDSVCNLLRACPELRDVKIDWYDTEDTPESRSVMTEQLTKFATAISTKTGWEDTTVYPAVRRMANVETHEHFSTPGTAHARNSPLALRRTEFDHLLLNGFNVR